MVTDEATNHDQYSLDEDDLADVMDEVLSLKSVYYSLGRSLRLKTDELKAICDTYSSESDAEQALENVLLLWLRQKYTVGRFGPPTWRMLVEAVDKKSCGNNHDLAKEIASNHPAGISYSIHDSHMTHNDLKYQLVGSI